MRRILAGGTLVTPEGLRCADVALEGEKIAEIAARIEPGLTDVVEDVTGCWVFPGFIDAHTHLQCWTGTDWTADSFETGTRARTCGAPPASLITPRPTAASRWTRRWQSGTRARRRARAARQLRLPHGHLRVGRGLARPDAPHARGGCLELQDLPRLRPPAPLGRRDAALPGGLPRPGRRALRALRERRCGERAAAARAGRRHHGAGGAPRSPGPPRPRRTPSPACSTLPRSRAPA